MHNGWTELERRQVGRIGLSRTYVGENRGRQPRVTRDCIFCAIIAGRQPASLVYRDELVCAFMDTAPLNEGHVLVVPIRHADSLADLDEATGARLFNIAQRVARALRRSALRCEGVNLYLSDGAAAGQVVPHVHLHVFPRYRGDGIGLRHGATRRGSRQALDTVARQIKAAL